MIVKGTKEKKGANSTKLNNNSYAEIMGCRKKIQFSYKSSLKMLCSKSSSGLVARGLLLKLPGVLSPTVGYIFSMPLRMSPGIGDEMSGSLFHRSTTYQTKQVLERGPSYESLYSQLTAV